MAFDWGVAMQTSEETICETIGWVQTRLNLTMTHRAAQLEDFFSILMNNNRTCAHPWYKLHILGTLFMYYHMKYRHNM